MDEDRALKILLADNRTNDRAGYDEEVLASLLKEIADEGDLIGTGYNDDDLKELIDDLIDDGLDLAAEDARKYTTNVSPVIYEPKGDKPKIEDIYDASPAREIIAKIEEAKLPEDLRDFLIAAAWRHTRIRFDRAAEFYAHAPREIQELMEDQALVIVDVNKAIEKGWAKLTKTLGELYDGEQGDED